jgi:hypothetical protein
MNYYYLIVDLDMCEAPSVPREPFTGRERDAVTEV